ncbi:MAG: T9SS type A sorting domain-containing protein [Bacteroidetes bacterium]|nr:T9SS type A sorting domain-containing protein [Bacteroidota bacterium]
MKKLYLLLLTVILGGTLSYFYFIGNKSYDSSIENRMAGDSYSESKEADKPDEYTKYFKAITTKFGEDEDNYPLNYRVNELETAKSKLKALPKDMKAGTITWTQRGPANVGGRTRGLIIDPDDATNNTWYAGSSTGGVWKTEDGGSTWECLTDDQLANLATVWLAMAETDHNVIYVGTGEVVGGSASLRGNGIYKSIDRGVTWTQLTSTITDDFQFVNRLIIDPTDEDIVLAATNAGVMKTIDGGATWTKKYSSSSRIEDIDADPTDFNTQYATQHGVGVIKSTDAGETWDLAIAGLEQGSRYEITVSEINPAKVYLSINASPPMAYRSTDYGATWEKFVTGGTLPDLLGQGDYDNIITGHPYDEDVVFIAGVNMFKLDFSDPGTTEDSDPQVYRIDQIGTESFIDFVEYTNANFADILGIGNTIDNGITDADFVSVEVRFGPGLSQKAHRFTVGGQGPGVADADYIYEDYVSVPFEVWDITNDRQLMVSFRDQAENEIFDLEVEDALDDTKAREYFFINAIQYAETENAEIAQDGGHAYKQMYFLWPRLAEGATWDPNNLPESKVAISYGTVTEVTGSLTTVADAYGSVNNYDQSAGFGTTKIPGLHPDHHNIVMVKTDEANEKFTIINANDGGLAISEDEGTTFEQLPDNYITTQFYGVAKKSGADEYIGGMQDNGTWATPDGENSSSTTDYIFHIGGDGFECVWHPDDADKIIGSVYYNSFRKTVNGGDSWAGSYNGIEQVTPFGGDTQYDGPFISKISYHKNDPDVLFAVGYNGIYKSTNFANSWTKTEIGEGWNSEYWTENQYVSSAQNIEVSLANKNIVWAGGAMSNVNGWKIFVSTDQGDSFHAVTEYSGADLNGLISGIATHPTEDSTAYLLFSFAKEPKILKTEDLGETWEDISGFGSNTSSSNGFPDVVTHCLVVMPYDPNTIWVGTDIGIIESTDGGATWNLLNSDLPAVSVYDMFVQDGQVVVATHGRGIWTAEIDELDYVPNLDATYAGFQIIVAEVEVVDAVDSVQIYVDNEYLITEETVVAGSNVFDINIVDEGEYAVQVKSFYAGNEYNSASTVVPVDFKAEIAVAKVTGENSVEITSTFTENYDSVQVFVNDSYNTSIDAPSTDFSKIIDLTETGSYTFYIYGYINGTASKSNEETLSFTYTGLNNISKINDLTVYPNPTRGNITVELPQNFNGNYNLNVYSISGAQVYSTVVSKSDNRINLYNLKDGLYIIRLEHEGEVYSQKIQLRK